MRNKFVGYLLLGISLIMGIIIWMFYRTLKETLSSSCTHGPTCTMFSVLGTQTKLSVLILGIIVLTAGILIFSKEEEKVIVKTKKIEDPHQKFRQEEIEKNMKTLNSEEKNIYEIIKNQSPLFQADLIEKSGVGKVTISRILDRLENKGLIERKRRGMNNIVALINSKN